MIVFEPDFRSALRPQQADALGGTRMIKRPFYPIIYVRGYAGTQGDIEDTTATPYMGFNLGATKYRQTETGEVRPWVFESPLIRLMKDYGYVDAYSDGQLLPEAKAPPKSIWIFRYYDVSSEAFGTKGARKEIEFHANRLREFILHVRDRVLDDREPEDQFRVHLVAHSMGGLVCRCYLQNPGIPDLDGRTGKRATHRGVDKLFTYATPHGGIDFRKGLGWVEGLRDFLDINNSANFGPKRMREFLSLADAEDLRSLGGRFAEDKAFALVGTDSRDYGAAAGLARRSVGPISDGLVQIEDAYTLGSPRAFVYRSHSGHFGIVNSEEGYQNLRRFLFGDTRAAVLLDNVRVQLPSIKNVSAIYYIETVVNVRGIPVDIHRRTIDTESAVFRTYDEIQSKPTHLFTCFLSKACRVRTDRRSLGFSVRVRIVPQYHVDKKLWLDNHYPGKAIFEEGIEFEVTPAANGKYRVTYHWSDEAESKGVNLVFEEKTDTGEVEGRVAFDYPLVSGSLVIRLADWNQ
jgi:pimeloyl-ACP methyl ester carboxylesterase